MKTQGMDKTLLITVLILSVFGLIIISSASVVVSYNNFEYNHYYSLHQFLYGFLPGIILLLLIQKIDYRIFKKYAVYFLIITMILLFVVFIPDLGFGLKGANRWINIAGISVQPSEFVKLTFILYLAAWLEKNKKNTKDFSKLLVPFILVLLAIVIPLILQPDVGTLIIIVLTAVIMYFISGARINHIVIIAMGSIFSLFILLKIAPYRMNRFMVFLYPEMDPQGIGYQINQALLALGSGGIFGLGFGRSRQKFNYLPEPIGDSIFAITGEELGFIGLLFLLSLFLIFTLRGYKIASRASDNFGRFIAVGITSWIIFQALVNMAAIISLIPLTGIPLPFISYGGSALITSLMGVGVLLSISRYSNK
ncbi:MAG: putative lipid II flippase FtsW [Patescibacteria group bacterium]|nr:putative lipid II flippase FtsW [Patescibacteria group bacterium]